MLKYLSVSKEEAIEVLRAVKRALLPYLKPVSTEAVSRFIDEPYNRDEAPKKWEDVDENRRKAVGVFFIKSLTFETADYIYVKDLLSRGLSS